MAPGLPSARGLGQRSRTPVQVSLAAGGAFGYGPRGCIPLQPRKMGDRGVKWNTTASLWMVGGEGHPTTSTPVQACIRREGVWNPKVCVPQMAQINISFCKFHFFPL